MQQLYEANNNLKACVGCGKFIHKEAKFCPYCGYKNRKPSQGIGWYIAFLIIFIFFLSQCRPDQDPSTVQTTSNAGKALPTPTATPKPTPAPKFEFVTGPTGEGNEYTYEITGILRNNTDRDYSYIQVTFTLYDRSGNNIGTAWANANNLKSGGTWKFNATAFMDDDEIARFELDDISGW